MKRWNDQFALSLDPDTAQSFHDETLPAEPGLDTEEAIEAAMAEKSVEFAEGGNRVYLPLVP